MYIVRTCESLRRATARICIGGLICAVPLSAMGQGPKPGEEGRLSAAAEARAVQQISELEVRKSHRSPIEQKIDAPLLDQMTLSQGKALTQSVKSYRTGIEVGRDGKVVVELVADITDQLLADLRLQGCEIIDVVPNFRSVLIRAPLTGLTRIASLSGVQHVSRQPIALTTSVTSEGDKTHAANVARSTYGLTGQGIKVGVLSDSVRYLSQSQSAGELPAVQVLDKQSGVGIPGDAGEGTAMLEIIHDLAPNAQLAFATALGSEARFAQNILNLQAAGCKVIVDDVGYIGEDAFQDDVIAKAVDTVAGRGVHFFSAAGNDGRKSNNTSSVWEGDFIAGASFGSGTLHRFGATSFNAAGAGSTFSLQWSDPHGAATNDYDLYITDVNGNVVFVSDTTQNGTSDPFEAIALPSPITGGYVAVVRFSGSARYLRVQSHRGTLAISTPGTTFGHSCAANATSVAAVNALASYPNTFGPANEMEIYSSDGPRKIFYDSQGLPYPSGVLASGGIVRQKPNLTGADNVQTSVLGFQQFLGTSASASHLAAIDALMLEVNPAFAQTPVDIRTNFLDATAWINADPASGKGIVNATGAVAKFIAANTKLTTSIGFGHLAGGRTCTGYLDIPSGHPFTVDLVYNLSASLPAIGVPSTVTIPAGSTHAEFPISNDGSSYQFGSTINATLAGTSFSTSVNLRLTYPLFGGVSLNPKSVYAGSSVLGTVSLTLPAESNLVVHLQSSNPNIVAVPSTVTILNGRTMASFVCETNGVDVNTPVTVTATVGLATTTNVITVNVAPLTAFRTTEGPFYGGSDAHVTGTIVLNGVAGPSGEVVALTSDSPAVIVPATVTVPAGAISVTFPIVHHSVSGMTFALLRATYLGKTLLARVTLKPIQAENISLSTALVYGGNSATVTVTLGARAPAGGCAVPLHSSSAAVMVPATLVVPEGQIKATATISTNLVTTLQRATISATRSSSVIGKLLTVKPYTVSGLTATPSGAALGLSVPVTLTVTLPAPVPAGKTIVVALSSSVPTLVQVPASVTFAAGEVSKNVAITIVPANHTQLVNLKATLNGVAKNVIFKFYAGS